MQANIREDIQSPLHYFPRYRQVPLDVLGSPFLCTLRQLGTSNYPRGRSVRVSCVYDTVVHVSTIRTVHAACYFPAIRARGRCWPGSQWCEPLLNHYFISKCTHTSKSEDSNPQQAPITHPHSFIGVSTLSSKKIEGSCLESMISL